MENPRRSISQQPGRTTVRHEFSPSPLQPIARLGRSALRFAEALVAALREDRLPSTLRRPSGFTTPVRPWSPFLGGRRVVPVYVRIESATTRHRRARMIAARR